MHASITALQYNGHHAIYIYICMIILAYSGIFLSNLLTSDLMVVCVFFLGFFFQIGNLKAHLKIHITDGPLKCRECGKQFTTSGRRTVCGTFLVFSFYTVILTCKTFAEVEFFSKTMKGTQLLNKKKLSLLKSCPGAMLVLQTI